MVRKHINLLLVFLFLFLSLSASEAKNLYVSSSSFVATSSTAEWFHGPSGNLSGDGSFIAPITLNDSGTILTVTWYVENGSPDSDCLQLYSKNVTTNTVATLLGEDCAGGAFPFGGRKFDVSKEVLGGGVEAYFIVTLHSIVVDKLRGIKIKYNP